MPKKRNFIPGNLNYNFVLGVLPPESKLETCLPENLQSKTGTCRICLFKITEARAFKQNFLRFLT